MNASLTPSSSIPAFQLTRNPHGRLVLTLADGTAHEGVTPVRAFPIAAPGEVHTGDAELWTTLSGRTAQHYTVRIERVGSGGQDANRDLTLRITDPALLSATGGIVQGMSGSPLVQD